MKIRDFLKIVVAVQNLVMQHLLNFEDNSSIALWLFVLLGILLQYGRVFAVLRDGFKITGGKKWMIRCLVRELCSMRKITGQTQHPPCSYIIVSVPPPPARDNLRSDVVWLLSCYCSLLEDKCLYCLVLPGVSRPGLTTQYLYPANFTTN